MLSSERSRKGPTASKRPQRRRRGPAAASAWVCSVSRRPRPPRPRAAGTYITSGVLEELPDDHEAHEEEEHIDDDHKELLQGKRGSVHKRPKVAATNPGGLKGLLTHGNTRDAGMAIYPSLADESYTHLTGPQKVAARAQRRASRGSVVSY